MEWYLAAWRKYAVFSGRARRKDCWVFVLISAVVTLVLGFVNGLLGADVPVLPLVYSLAVMLPSLTVTVRRLHDTDRSGWWIFVSLVPVVGAVVLFVFLATHGTEGANRFGDKPKAIDASGTWAL